MIEVRGLTKHYADLRRGKLVALPMKIEETCAAPCRVLFVEE